jgi:hypothetical protein
MGVIDVLTRLDERVVPRLARGIVRVQGLVRGGGAIRPLPIIAALLIATLLTTAVWRLGHSDGSGNGGHPLKVGLPEGVRISDYSAESRRRLGELGQSAPNRPVYALVSLSMYVHPMAVAELVRSVGGPMTTVEALARLPKLGRDTEIVHLYANHVPDDLTRAMSQLADRKAVDSTAYDGLALRETDKTQMQLYRSNADLASEEAVEYRRLCACIFALVVRADPRVLERLATARLVRIVDPAPDLASVDLTTQFSPVLPEQTDRVATPTDDESASPSSVPTPKMAD